MGPQGLQGPIGPTGPTGATGPGNGWQDDGAVVRLINGADKVGIGTTSPQAKLHVAEELGAGTVSAPIIMTRHWGGTTDTRGGGIFNYHNSATFNDQLVFTVTGDGGSYTSPALYGNAKMVIQANGNVGIGTTTPGNILTVLQGSATDPIADAWTVYSSRRWKTNIKPIENALEKVLGLRGVTYDWKADGKHDIGLIAEEVGEVIPEVVEFEKNGKDAKSVDYARLVALLIQAVKEQQKQISEQAAQLRQQQSLVTALKADVTRVRQELTGKTGHSVLASAADSTAAALPKDRNDDR